jgi:DNA primase large subunit
MDYSPSAKELSHFPFLKKAQDHIKNRFSSIDSVLNDPKGEALVRNALARIQESLLPKKTEYSVTLPAEDEIAAYALARVIVSCINDRQLLDRLTRYEAERAYYFLNSEIGSETTKGWNDDAVLDDDMNSGISNYVAAEFEITLAKDRIPLVDYVEVVSQLHEDRFKLVNRRIQRGFIEIRRDEVLELLRERIRVILRRDLPYRVPKNLCQQLAPAVEQIKAEYQSRMLQQFGTIEESAFPPCMQALITALTAGTNLTHAGRFALTTFLHTIGMDVAGIANLYGRSPDFDIEKTMYQVEHITGRGGSGTEYTTPACAAMLTTGICVHKDKLCERVSHPLSYYKAKKKDIAKIRKPAVAEQSGEGKTPAPPT